MDIFFIRHGQTDMNARHIHQGPNEPLNELGRAQAAVIAEYLKEQRIDTLFSSTFTRARETAAVISEAIDVPVMPTESVVEFRRPDSIYGSRHLSWGTLTYLWNFFRHRYDNDWNFESAENMFDIRNRVHDAKNEIAASHGERVVVVSHAIFMNMFVELICNEVDLSLAQFVRGLFKTLRTKNTELFHIRYINDPEKQLCEWRLVEKITV